MYKIVWDSNVYKDLKKIDKTIGNKIIQKVETNLSKDPLLLGKKLIFTFSGLLSYRIEDYRVLYEVINNTLVVHVVKISHRKNVYIKK